MRNTLATHLTTWKAWYAILAAPALLLGSTVSGLTAFLPGLSESAGRTLSGLLVPLQFIVFAGLALALIALVSRRWPTSGDLGLRRGFTGRDVAVVLAVFAVTHLAFWLIGLAGPADPGQAQRYFGELNLTGPPAQALAGVVASVILAPVCEEILYRGAVLRPVHDAIARRGSTTVAAVVSILVSAIAFALPHLGGSLLTWQSFAYVLSGAAFGLVYVLTGSMTAAMVSHSLQSCAAFGQILLFGRGDVDVSPIVWILVFGCPLWVYLVARGLRAVLPTERGRVGERRAVPANHGRGL